MESGLFPLSSADIGFCSWRRETHRKVWTVGIRCPDPVQPLDFELSHNKNPKPELNKLKETVSRLEESGVPCDSKHLQVIVLSGLPAEYDAQKQKFEDALENEKVLSIEQMCLDIQRYHDNHTTKFSKKSAH